MEIDVFCGMHGVLMMCYFPENETNFAEEVIRLFFQLILASKTSKYFSLPL